MKKILIRVDGSTSIGLGHITRCQALAEMLVGEFEITFLYRDLPQSIVRNPGMFSYRRIKDENEFLESLMAGQVVVLDGYQFDRRYQENIKAKGALLIWIDDRHEIATVADLVINHAPSIKPSDYRAKAYTMFALGPDYALLRKPFLDAAKNPRDLKVPKSLLICFGGGDYLNLTQRTVEKIKYDLRFETIMVVVGAGYKFINNLQKTIVVDSRISLHSDINAEEMLLHMLKTETAIVPSSGILLEALASQCVVISGYYTDNQIDMYNGFLNINAFVDAGTFSDAEIERAIEQIPYAVSRAVIDGRSGDRILEKIKQIA